MKPGNDQLSVMSPGNDSWLFTVYVASDCYPSMCGGGYVRCSVASCRKKTCVYVSEVVLICRQPKSEPPSACSVEQPPVRSVEPRKQTLASYSFVSRDSKIEARDPQAASSIDQQQIGCDSRSVCRSFRPVAYHPVLVQLPYHPHTREEKRGKEKRRYVPHRSNKLMRLSQVVTRLAYLD